MKRSERLSEEEAAIQIMAGYFLPDMIDLLDRHPAGTYMHIALLTFLRMCDLTEEQARAEVSQRVPLAF